MILKRRRDLARLSKIELIDRVLELESAAECYGKDAACAQEPEPVDLGLKQ